MTTGKTVKLTDLSVSGYLTADLLAQVQASTNAAAIASADVITISIGGNDILAAGANSGYSLIDETQFSAISAAVRGNLDATLAKINELNPDVKIILMNFMNLYNPTEMSSDGKNLNVQADSFLNPTNSEIGNIFNDMKVKYNLILADTYSMFETVNVGESGYTTAGTYASMTPILNPPYQMAPITSFPARFITNGSTVESPFNAWAVYESDWSLLQGLNYSIAGFIPSSGVAIDLYMQFYNPRHYVFGHDETTSELINMIKDKYGWFSWILFGNTVLNEIMPFEKWRDVHCTALGHSLIAKAHIEAWEASAQ
jgi:hypothetical protein